MSTSTVAQLSELVSLISNATKVVEAHFAKSSKPYVPSLDDIEPHPLDITSGSSDLRNAIHTIEGACAQLVATVSRPTETVFRKVSAMAESACLEVVTNHNVAGLLSKHQDKGLHVSKIAEQTGLNENKLGRILRSLATRHVFREVSEGVFVNNRLSIQLHTSLGLAEFIQFLTQEILGAIPHFNDTLVHNEWAHSFEPHHSAFNKRSGFSKGLFEYYSGEHSETGRKLGARHSAGMVGWASITESASVLSEFPWGNLPAGTKVVDVGSGRGSMSIQLAKQYPTLQLYLQDRPERIKEAKEKFWPQRCPEAIAEGRVHFQPVDFFTQTLIPGADIYFLGNTLHVWEDGLACKILRNVRNAMSPHSRVLMCKYNPIYANTFSRLIFTQFAVEQIVRSPAPHSEERYISKEAPAPLLPNYGMGRVLPTDVDIMVMIVINGIERSLTEHVALGEKAGLKFVKLWDLGSTGVVEFGLA